ncbi:hypothetical protein PFISCL1PPCAC_17239, partial [Pristionchus fissidentatus]
TRFADDFEAIKVIGRGAFGCVFEAKNVLEAKNYAIKRIELPSCSDEGKLLMEMRVMAHLDHPNIVRYYTSWIERPPPRYQVNHSTSSEMENLSRSHTLIPFSDNCAFIYIQMQLCTHSLEDWLRNTHEIPRDPARIKSIFKELVDAVAYMHDKGFIHRDLKPSNILFDEENRIRVCDMGITSEFNKLEGREVTESRTSIGTPLYAAPEQVRHFWRYTSKVDVFSLGLIYVELSVQMSVEMRRTVSADLFRH